MSDSSNIISITYSVFDSLKANVVGSILNIGSSGALSNFSLCIYTSTFSYCTASTSQYGGLIVFKIQEGKLIITKNCIYSCTGYEGSF